MTPTLHLDLPETGRKGVIVWAHLLIHHDGATTVSIVSGVPFVDPNTGGPVPSPLLLPGPQQLTQGQNSFSIELVCNAADTYRVGIDVTLNPGGQHRVWAAHPIIVR